MERGEFDLIAVGRARCLGDAAVGGEIHQGRHRGTGGLQPGGPRDTRLSVSPAVAPRAAA